MEAVEEVIAWASQKGYFLWYVNQFENAIDFIEARMNQIKSKGEEIPEDLRHQYALALRDYGRVDEAIEIFRKGRDLSVYESVAAT